MRSQGSQTRTLLEPELLSLSTKMPTKGSTLQQSAPSKTKQANKKEKQKIPDFF